MTKEIKILHVNADYTKCFFCQEPLTLILGDLGIMLAVCPKHENEGKVLMERSVSNRDLLIRNLLAKPEPPKPEESPKETERHHPKCECPKCRPNQKRTVEVKK